MRCLPTKVDRVQGWEPRCSAEQRGEKVKGQCFQIDSELSGSPKHIGIVSLQPLAGLSVDLILIRFRIYLLQMETLLQYIILMYHKQNGLIILLNSKQERK